MMPLTIGPERRHATADTPYEPGRTVQRDLGPRRDTPGNVGRRPGRVQEPGIVGNASRRGLVVSFDGADGLRRDFVGHTVRADVCGTGVVVSQHTMRKDPLSDCLRHCKTTRCEWDSEMLAALRDFFRLHGYRPV